MKKKVLKAGLLALAAVVLVVATVLATIAYLTASSAVSNVFTVGNVSIAMFEHKVNSDGTLFGDGKVEVDTNSYHLLPAQTYTKDPTIRILSQLQNGQETSDSMYLFVKSSNQIRTIEDGNVNSDSQNLTMRQQMKANGWVEFVQSGNGIEIVWLYGTRQSDGTIVPTSVDKNSVQTRGDGTTGPAGEFRLCENFTVAAGADVSPYTAAKVTFTGFAIQDAGLSTTREAWEAIKAAYPYEGGIADPKNPYDPTKDAYEPVPITPVNP